MNQMNIFQDHTIYFGVKSIIKVHSYLHTCIWHDFKFFEKGKETIVKSINTINSNYTYLRKHALLVSEGQETLTLFVSFLKLANFAWTSFKLISRGTGAREDTHKFLHPSCSVLFQFLFRLSDEYKESERPTGPFMQRCRLRTTAYGTTFGLRSSPSFLFAFHASRVYFSYILKV